MALDPGCPAACTPHGSWVPCICIRGLLALPTSWGPRPSKRTPHSTANDDDTGFSSGFPLLHCSLLQLQILSSVPAPHSAGPPRAGVGADAAPPMQGWALGRARWARRVRRARREVALVPAGPPPVNIRRPPGSPPSARSTRTRLPAMVGRSRLALARTPGCEADLVGAGTRAVFPAVRGRRCSRSSGASRSRAPPGYVRAIGAAGAAGRSHSYLRRHSRAPGKSARCDCRATAGGTPTAVLERHRGDREPQPVRNRARPGPLLVVARRLSAGVPAV